MLRFLDAGSAVADATAVITDFGFTAAEAGVLMPLAISGYCTEHLPT
ncbi:hypothetical protein HQ305_12455 [Rhodococcus sp. BP-149]|nr:MULTISPECIES: hypothetical protein [unclassified Rhodococcus (in: high G+C Gram-positive bacteria)]MBY6685588.1 hypothetical protein [Rhodococcus sp. BP-288]MBY6694864.1 hypothetical protein [Rhodococcus sp. BP-188]MBY6696710.1 hypothetical protein [Rhodococcus sp. BP-285]MBY6703366.1 hypothetical protein [Rhodococcus sp. BP-283]MBY6710680.1 hypothetical protein [Rhodococcus sp. BP-160]